MVSQHSWPPISSSVHPVQIYEFDPDPHGGMPLYNRRPEMSCEYSPADGVPNELFLEPPISLHQKCILDFSHPSPCNVLAALDEDPWPAGQKLPSWVADKAWSPAPYVLLYYSRSDAWIWMNVVTGGLRSSPPKFDPDWKWQVECPRGWRRAWCPSRMAWFWWSATKQKSQWQIQGNAGKVSATPLPVYKPLPPPAARAAFRKMEKSPTFPTSPAAVQVAKPPLGPLPEPWGEVLQQKPQDCQRGACVRSAPARAARNALVAAGLLPVPQGAPAGQGTKPTGSLLAGAEHAVAEPAVADPKPASKDVCAGDALRAEANAKPSATSSPGSSMVPAAVLHSMPARRGKFRGQPFDDEASTAWQDKPEFDLQQDPEAESNIQYPSEASAVQWAGSEALGRASHVQRWQAMNPRVRRPTTSNGRWITCKEASEGSDFCKPWNDHRSCGSGDISEPCKHWCLHRCDLMLATGRPCCGAHTRHTHDPEVNGKLMRRHGRGGQASATSATSETELQQLP
jgi:hypothetical protein